MLVRITGIPSRGLGASLEAPGQIHVHGMDPVGRVVARKVAGQRPARLPDVAIAEIDVHVAGTEYDVLALIVLDAGREPNLAI